jgi:hypothetical protein
MRINLIRKQIVRIASNGIYRPILELLAIVNNYFRLDTLINFGRKKARSLAGDWCEVVRIKLL